MAKPEPRFTETRTIHPFAMSQKALTGVKFRFSADQNYMDERTWRDEDIDATPEVFQSEIFVPKFKLAVNADSLKSESGLAASELLLSIVLQDDAAWESTQLAQWPLTKYPDEYAVDPNVLKQVCGQRGITFSVIVSPVAAQKSGAARGDVIARADFDIPTPSDGNDFPVQVLKSDDFEKKELSRDTAWVVEWLNEDGFDELSLADCLNVLIHEDVDARLASATNFHAGKLIWQSIACEILTEVAIKYFSTSPSETPGPKTLGGMIMNVMKKGSGGKEASQLIAEAAKPGMAARMRSYSQAALGIKADIAGLKLKGMLS
ncbi:MAG: hypothetical protein AB7P97_20905 [Hyphomonadaceae bacterium]